jgi:predicted GIY-YIG superfamily endonuclease
LSKENIKREFDPGSGRTLAACLTHASRTKYVFRNDILGYTSNLKVRIKQHRNNYVDSTRNKNPQLVYYEAFKSRKDAMAREQKLKQGQSKRHLIDRIQDSIKLCE